jgi:hypothetical protein
MHMFYWATTVEDRPAEIFYLFSKKAYAKNKRSMRKKQGFA